MATAIPRMKLVPGLRITENIQLHARIAVGGMGEIWAADHLPLLRRVVIKCVTAPLADNVEILRRFAFEAQIVARLRGGHVPQIFDYGLLRDGRPFMVMEHLTGVDLHARLRYGPPLSVQDTEKVVGHVGAALAETHALDVVHRDVKPENIFLATANDGGFEAKLLDFGIAKVRSIDGAIVHPAGAVLGTPSYMSPEQISNANDVDGRSDVWSLAVVAYASLTGRLPFPGDKFDSLRVSIQNGLFAPPSQLRSDLPRELDEWFRKALRVERNARFDSATTATEAFSRAAHPLTPAVATTHPVVAGPPPSQPLPGPASSQSRRRRRSRPSSEQRETRSVVLALAACAVVVTWDPTWNPSWSSMRVHAASLAGDVSRWIGPGNTAKERPKPKPPAATDSAAEPTGKPSSELAMP
jgi:eukaryotic-like serine/threonine-protein kinase